MASSDWSSLTTWLSAVGLCLHIKALSLQYFYFPQCCLLLLQCRLWWIMLSKVLPDVTSVSQQWLIKMIIWNHYKRWWKIWWPDIIVNVVSFTCKMDNCEQCHFEYTSHFPCRTIFFQNQGERVTLSSAKHDLVSYATCPRKYFWKSVSLFTFLLNEWLHFHYFIQNQHNMIRSGVSNSHLSLLEIQSFSFSSKAVQ